MSISTSYSGDCIPISVGDIVEIKGNQLTVRNSYFLGDYSYHRFIQKEYEAKEVEEVIKTGLCDTFVWFTDDSCWEDLVPSGLRHLNLTHLNNAIYQAMIDFVYEIDFMNTQGIVEKNCNIKIFVKVFV